MNRIVAIAGVALLAGSAQAALVDVEVTGTVFFNGINEAPLSGVSFGDSVVVAFQVDSEHFVDGVPGDTRGYLIDGPSFTVTFGGDLGMGLIDPFPAGETPYFGVVDGFPVSDGFFISTSTTSPGGVPLEQDPFNLGFNVGYEGDTLSSLDILDAVGTYGFDGLTNYGFSLWSVFPENQAMGIDFESMTISVPGPGTLVLLVPLAFGVRRRRRA